MFFEPEYLEIIICFVCMTNISSCLFTPNSTLEGAVTGVTIVLLFALCQTFFAENFASATSRRSDMH